MRDDSHKWDSPPTPDAVITAPGVTIRQAHFERMCLLSGPGIAGMESLGWPDIARPGPRTLRLRRDRVLEIDGPARPDGWDGALAVSDMSDGYGVALLQGPAALDLLSRGAELSLNMPSASSARLVFGLPALLFRSGEAEVTLMFQRARFTAGWTALAAAARAMAD